jgi:hypothetical protein
LIVEQRLLYEGKLYFNISQTLNRTNQGGLLGIGTLEAHLAGDERHLDIPGSGTCSYQFCFGFLRPFRTIVMRLMIRCAILTHFSPL